MYTFNCSLRKVLITLAGSDDLFSCPADRPVILATDPPQDGDDDAVAAAYPIGYYSLTLHVPSGSYGLWIMSNSGEWSRLASIEPVTIPRPCQD